MPEKDKPKKRGMAIIEGQENIEAKFVEHASINSNNERLILDFFQVLPEGWQAKLNDVNDVGEDIDIIPTKLIARLVFTWPHFKRFVDMVNRIYNKQKDTALLEMRDTLSGGGDNEGDG